MQNDISQHYASTKPGEVQVLGVDLWNGTTSQVNSFRTTTGATYPLLLQGASPTGGDLQTLYGTYDNYVVLNKQGVVRYHAALQWPHGNRYHLAEIRACVDSLVSQTLDAPEGGPSAVSLSASPNPARMASRLSLSLPAPVADARLTIHDVAGRQVSTLWQGPLAAGRHEFDWDSRGARQERLAAGVYLVRAALGAESRVLRLVVVR